VLHLFGAGLSPIRQAGGVDKNGYDAGDHQETASDGGRLNAVSNLAKERQHLGEYEAADSLFRHVLASYEARFGADHHLIALVMQDLAEIQHLWGHLDEAEGFHRESLAMRRRVFGGEHRQVAWALSGLAMVRRDRGAAAESEALLREALDIQRRVGDTERNIASTMEKLADVRGTAGLPRNRAKAN